MGFLRERSTATTQRRLPTAAETAFAAATARVAQEQAAALQGVGEGVNRFALRNLQQGQGLNAQQLALLQGELARFYPQTPFANLTLPQATQFVQQGGLSPLIRGGGGSTLADDERIRLIAEQERLGARDFSQIQPSLPIGFNPRDDDPVARLTEVERAENRRRRISERESVARLAEIEGILGANAPTGISLTGPGGLEDFQEQQTLQLQQRQAQDNLRLQQQQRLALAQAQPPTPSTGVNLGGQNFRSSLTPILNQPGGGRALPPPGQRQDQGTGLAGGIGRGTLAGGIGRDALGGVPSLGLNVGSAALQRAAVEGRLLGQTAASTAGGLPLSQEAFNQQFRDALGIDELVNTQNALRAQSQLLFDELGRIQAGPGVPTEQQLAAIEDARRAQVASGEFDIERGETEAYRALREELAPRLGLRPTDSPVIDRGGLISAEALRQRGQLAQTAAQAAAQARLQYPLAANQLLSQQTARQQNLGFAISQFQQNLNQQAFENRLRLQQGVQQASQQPGLFGASLLTGIQPQSSAFANIANAQNLGTVTSQSPGLGQIAGAAGGLLRGLGEIGFRPFGP